MSVIVRSFDLGPNHNLAVDFLSKVALLSRDQRLKVADEWQRRRSLNRDEYIEAAFCKAVSRGRFLYIVNAGNIIAANRSFYALDPDGTDLLDDKLEFANGIWIRALERVVKILVVSDLLSQDLVAEEIEPFNNVFDLQGLNSASNF